MADAMVTHASGSQSVYRTGLFTTVESVEGAHSRVVRFERVGRCMVIHMFPLNARAIGSNWHSLHLPTREPQSCHGVRSDCTNSMPITIIPAFVRLVSRPRLCSSCGKSFTDIQRSDICSQNLV